MAGIDFFFLKSSHDGDHLQNKYFSTYPVVTYIDK